MLYTVTMQSPFQIDPKTGLGTFPALNTKGITNITTCDNKIWGNLNPYYSKTEAEKLEIEEKDHQLSQLLQAKTCLVLTTPPEETILSLDTENLDYLKHGNPPDNAGFRYILIRANAIIAHNLQERVEFVVAPHDCPIVFFKHATWPGCIVMHLGAPQVLQNLHTKTLKMWQVLFPDFSAKDFTVYISPYICPKHYSISEEKYTQFSKVSRAPKTLDQFLSKRKNPILKEDRHYFDFVGLAKAELTQNFGITKFVESGLCTYEEALKDRLFSHELAQEKDHLKDPEAEKFKGCNNVAFVCGQ